MQKFIYGEGSSGGLLNMEEPGAVGQCFPRLFAPSPRFSMSWCTPKCYYVESHPLKITNQPLHAHKKLFYLLLWHISPLEQRHQNLHSVDSSITHYLLYWLVRHLVYLLSTLPCWESVLLVFFPVCSG